MLCQPQNNARHRGSGAIISGRLGLLDVGAATSRITAATDMDDYVTQRGLSSEPTPIVTAIAHARKTFIAGYLQSLKNKVSPQRDVTLLARRAAVEL